MRSLTFESDSSSDDSITFSAPINKHVTVTIDEPWSGCTETGFGSLCLWDLSVEQMRAVISHLQDAISEIEGEE